MKTLEDLDGNTRALILAKLTLQLQKNGCVNIFELAKKQHIDIAKAWREICRLAGQPTCAVPRMLTHAP